MFPEDCGGGGSSSSFLKWNGWWNITDFQVLKCRNITKILWLDGYLRSGQESSQWPDAPQKVHNNNRPFFSSSSFFFLKFNKWWNIMKNINYSIVENVKWMILISLKENWFKITSVNQSFFLWHQVSCLHNPFQVFRVCRLPFCDVMNLMFLNKKSVKNGLLENLFSNLCCLKLHKRKNIHHKSR